MEIQSGCSRPRTAIPPPLPFALAIAVGWWLDRRVVPLTLGDSHVALWFGGIAVAMGLCLFVWALWTLHKHHTTVNPFKGSTSLCTGGPFGLSRNPIYLADWVILLGAAFLMGSAWPLVFSPALWYVIRYRVIAYEEEYLTARFGSAYTAYRESVRRWL